MIHWDGREETLIMRLGLRSDTDVAGQYTDYPFAGWVKTAADADLAEMIGGNAFLTDVSGIVMLAGIALVVVLGVVVLVVVWRRHRSSRRLLQ